jgi:erythritol transport system substrate-binding protein
MFKKGLRIVMAAVAVAPLLTGAAWAAGQITVIVNDPSNPYWLTEGNIAKATAEKLGYTATVGAHKGDTNTESNLIDTAITNKSVAIILDPANADGSVGAVKKAVAAGIPVFLVNAEINQEGLAKAQLVSNNAQGAAIGAQQWVEAGVISGNDEMALGAIAALKEAGKLANVKVGGFDGSPDAVAAIKAGELQYTVLQPVAIFSEEAVKQADSFIKTGKTGAKSEKQLFDCILITKDNVDKYTAPFVLAQ